MYTSMKDRSQDTHFMNDFRWITSINCIIGLFMELYNDALQIVNVVFIVLYCIVHRAEHIATASRFTTLPNTPSPGASPRGGPHFLPEVVPGIDANAVSFYWGRGSVRFGAWLASRFHIISMTMLHVTMLQVSIILYYTFSFLIDVSQKHGV